MPSTKTAPDLTQPPPDEGLAEKPETESVRSSVDRWVENRRRQIAIGCSIFAALRIVLFVALFPVGNNVDERFHLSTIQMYAEGQIPGRDLPLIDRGALRDLIRYYSPEYRTADPFERGDATDLEPLIARSPQEQEEAFTQKYYADKLRQWERRPNYEAHAAPLYYLIAAGWYDFGESLGLHTWRLFYWLRSLNAFAYGLFVWLSFKFASEVYDHTFLSVAIPALLAVFPQDVFFGLNRDVLSPLLAAGVLILMIRVVRDPARRSSLILASSLVGLMFLIEVSNFVFFGVLAAMCGLYIARSEDVLRKKIRVICVSSAAATVPPLLWMLRNLRVMGDLTGSSAKVRELGWTLNPISNLLRHPLFSVSGSIYFLVHLTQSFWRGEYLWHGLPMRSAVADPFYVVSSAVALIAFLCFVLARWRSLDEIQKWAALSSLFLVSASYLFLALISVLFDYHDCAYPSRLHPFFVSGRIISGVLLPFALIYSGGLMAVMGKVRRWISPYAILALLLAFIAVSEVRVRSVVFGSPYNFVALSGWRL